jgi:hypothetical protein
MNVNKEIKFDYGLNEAYSTGLQYAILDNNGDIRHKPIRCKDYIQDVYWSEILKKGAITQYGFKWDGNNTNPVSKQDKVSVVLISDNGVSLQQYKDNLQNLLNIIENTLDIPNSEVINSSSCDKDIIVTYDNKWSEKPYLLSMLYLLMRVGLYYKRNNNDIYEVVDYLTNKNTNLLSNDIQQLLSINKNKKFEELFINNELPKQKWSDYKDTSSIHNNSGIMSFKFKNTVENGIIN